MRPRFHPPFIPLVFLAVVLAGAHAEAMVVVQRDFPELVARAEQIVVGTVTEIRQAPDESGTPYTWVTLSDLTVLKGTVGPTFTVRLSGGAAGAVAVRIPDMPTFTLGERALLFVAGNGRDVCPLVGVWQGRFRLRFDPVRGTEIVEDNDGTPVLGRSGRTLRRAQRAQAQPAQAQPAGTDAGAVTVGQFQQLIADEIAHPSADATVAP